MRTFKAFSEFCTYAQSLKSEKYLVEKELYETEDVKIGRILGKIYITEPDECKKRALIKDFANNISTLYDSDNHFIKSILDYVSNYPNPCIFIIYDANPEGIAYYKSGHIYMTMKQITMHDFTATFVHEATHMFLDHKFLNSSKPYHLHDTGSETELREKIISGLCETKIHQISTILSSHERLTKWPISSRMQLSMFDRMAFGYDPSKYTIELFSHWFQGMAMYILKGEDIRINKEFAQYLWKYCIEKIFDIASPEICPIPEYLYYTEPTPQIPKQQEERCQSVVDLYKACFIGFDEVFSSELPLETISTAIQYYDYAPYIIKQLFKSPETTITTLLSSACALQIMEASGDGRYVFIKKLFNFPESVLTTIFSNEGAVKLLDASDDCKYVFIKKLFNLHPKILIPLLSEGGALKLLMVSDEHKNTFIEELLSLNDEILESILDFSLIEAIINATHDSPYFKDKIYEFLAHHPETLKYICLNKKHMIGSEFYAKCTDLLYQFVESGDASIDETTDRLIYSASFIGVIGEFLKNDDEMFD